MKQKKLSFMYNFTKLCISPMGSKEGPGGRDYFTFQGDRLEEGGWEGRGA